MSDFFHGWRRKAGCVALVTACVFASGWVRSFWLCDVLSFGQHEFCHVLGRLSWARLKSKNPDEPVWWSSFEISPAFGSHDRSWRFDSRVWIAPDWSIVIPLTLLSAYLILWPSKRKTAQPTQNPT